MGRAFQKAILCFVDRLVSIDVERELELEKLPSLVPIYHIVEPNETQGISIHRGTDGVERDVSLLQDDQQRTT